MAKTTALGTGSRTKAGARRKEGCHLSDLCVSLQQRRSSIEDDGFRLREDDDDAEHSSSLDQCLAFTKCRLRSSDPRGAIYLILLLWVAFSYAVFGLTLSRLFNGVSLFSTPNGRTTDPRRNNPEGREENRLVDSEPSSWSELRGLWLVIS